MAAQHDRLRPRIQTDSELAETRSSEEYASLASETKDASPSHNTADPEGLVGQRIGKYRILRQLGSGGMGVVYEAIHESIGQRAAVKVLRPRISLDPQYIERFFNEARAAVVAQDASLVKLFDYGPLSSGVLYMLMELLEGESLRQRMAQIHRFSDAAAVRLCRQVASAIAVVHDRGIVHRDLKSENLFIVRDIEAAGGERAKILDFGLARISSATAVPGSRAGQESIAGTPLYMAPDNVHSRASVGDQERIRHVGKIWESMGPLQISRPLTVPNERGSGSQTPGTARSGPCSGASWTAPGQDRRARPPWIAGPESRCRRAGCLLRRADSGSSARTRSGASAGSETVC